MIPKKKWFDRRFSLELPVWMFTNIVERLRGTPARVEEMTRSLNPETLTRQDDDQWSVQVNVGHLSDLEPMWIGRIDDILRGADRLRATDIENRGADGWREFSKSAVVPMHLRNCTSRVCIAVRA